jgi:hypothetical protein
MGISSFGIKIPVDSKVYGKEMDLSLTVSCFALNLLEFELTSSHGTTSNFANSSRIGH